MGGVVLTEGASKEVLMDRAVWIWNGFMAALMLQSKSSESLFVRAVLLWWSLAGVAESRSWWAFVTFHVSRF
eukprot:scaffold2408_cov123-Skeletonema_dohrnii-CCMP3373.AAC.9